jgi:DNA-binding XRE family transcriptional regulator
MKNYEQELKRLREHLGLSQVQISKKIGVHVNTYRFWEQGVGDPSYENRIKIKELLAQLASKKQAD